MIFSRRRCTSEYVKNLALVCYYTDRTYKGSGYVGFGFDSGLKITVENVCKNFRKKHRAMAVAPIKASGMNEISRQENRNTGIKPKKPKRVSIWIDAGYLEITNPKSPHTIVVHIRQSLQHHGLCLNTTYYEIATKLSELQWSDTPRFSCPCSR